MVWSFTILETESTTREVEQWAFFGAGVDTTAKSLVLANNTPQQSFYKRYFNDIAPNTGLFEMIVCVLTTCHLVLQMQSHVISFYGVTSRIRFVFLLFPQVSRNWRYESEPTLKPSPLTCYKQFGTNLIIVSMHSKTPDPEILFMSNEYWYWLSVCRIMSLDTTGSSA